PHQPHGGLSRGPLGLPGLDRRAIRPASGSIDHRPWYVPGGGGHRPGCQGDRLTVRRMDNVGIVVEDLDAAIAFFSELGLTLEGRMPIEGEWAGRVTGVRGQRVEVAMMRTPDG